ncbi:MAG: hypothetical protein KDK70_26740, partial [Myxococcales bacterium]|nr:hypothetical protein [Myxococcales bacterium]
MADWKKLLDDTVGQLGDAAQAASEGLRQAAGEAGKVLGIGVGSLAVQLGRSSVRMGERLEGTVSLRLEEPIAA